MEKIWDASFFCELCKQKIETPVCYDKSRELTEELRRSLLRHVRENHFYDKHLECWGCKKHIKVDQIETVIPLPNGEAGDLCKVCAEKYKTGKNRSN